MNLPSGCVEACPGCRYRELSPAESNRQKQAWSERNLGFLGVPLPSLDSSRHRWGYRRKACLHAELRADGWALGLRRRRGRETELIAIPDCPLHSPELNQMLHRLVPLLPREIPLAFVLATGALLTLVLKCRASEDWRAWARSLEPRLRPAGVEGLQVNWHPSAGHRVLSSRHQERIFGPYFLHDGEVFYGAQSFRQQIPELEQKAVSLAEDFLADARRERVVDLYSGGGSTLARWRRRGWNAVGVEMGGEACRVAEKNAPSTLILRGKVEHRLIQLAGDYPPESFVLYTNPPRDGHSASVLAWILAARPVRLAYLSCNPRSLARDLKILAEQYAVHGIHPFDFFPQTDHVESLALLELREKKADI